MSILSQADKDALNKMADTNPSLNKVGLPFGQSQVRLGDILEQLLALVEAKDSEIADLQQQIDDLDARLVAVEP